MTSESRYISSLDFIENIDFEYIETYSLQRGEKYEREIRNSEFSEYNSLKGRKTTLNDIEIKRFEYLEKLHGSTQYLIDSDCNFHPTAIKTNVFKKESPIVTELISILETKIIEVPSWMCAPIYRDAIVFYNKQKNIKSVLNVCLSCEYMELKRAHYVNADKKTYSMMKQFFISIGHEVEAN